MRRIAPWTALLLLPLVGCGSQTAAQDQGSSVGGGDGAQTAWQDCDTDAFAEAGPPVASLSHDGWVSAIELKVPADGPCAGGLVASGPAGVVGLDVSQAALDGSTTQVLDAGDLGGSVLVRVDGGVHPRGGFQPHLYLVGPDEVREVTEGDHPVVPFVATDGGMAPLAVRCGDGTLDVDDATASEPPGIILAWDVHRTTYTFGVGGARRTSAGLVEQDAADPVLRRDRPELFDPGRLFTGC